MQRVGCVGGIEREPVDWSGTSRFRWPVEGEGRTTLSERVAFEIAHPLNRFARTAERNGDFMSNDRVTAGADDHTLDLLRTSLDSMPLDLLPGQTSPPGSVPDGARWVHDWLNMDAELAELTFDSTENLELAGIRSTGSLRELTFVSGDRTIEIEIEPGRRAVDVSGMVDPPVSGTVQLVVAARCSPARSTSRVRSLSQGCARGTALAFVETPTGKIRLGVFEI